MKFKNVRDFIKKINKDRIMQVGAVCIGTMLITTLSLKTEDNELIENYNHGTSFGYEKCETFFCKMEEYKTANSVVIEVIQGKYGNGENRKQNLEANGYNYDEIQSEVNEYYKKFYEEQEKPNPEPLPPSAYTPEGPMSYEAAKECADSLISQLGGYAYVELKETLQREFGVLKGEEYYEDYIYGR